MRCLSCAEETDAQSTLCQNCWPDAHFFSGAMCESCGIALLGETHSHRDFCETCHRNPPPWGKGRAVGLYEGPLRKMVLGLKHGDRHDIAPHIAQWMFTAGGDVLAPDTLIAPVPLHWTRMMRRTFNQTVLIGNSLSEKSGLEFVPDFLNRTRPTPPQKDMTRQERFENQRDAIALHPKHAGTVAGKTVLLIDDVMTTGATLSACTEAALAAGASEVNILVFARVARPE